MSYNVFYIKWRVNILLLTDGRMSLKDTRDIIRSIKLPITNESKFINLLKQ